MSLVDLHIHHLRNIEKTRLTLHPHFNLFVGANGSGKTSLLEAIYLLSTGHSFRTREISPLISNNHPSLTVFASTVTEETISIQKLDTGSTRVKLNKQPCSSSSDLARFLPCQVFYQDIFQIIDAGPAVRRSLLDWGLFHVKQAYHHLWKDYRRVLKQRNTLLRKRAPKKEFSPWDDMLVSISNELHNLRVEYFEVWSASFQSILEKLTDTPCTIRYYKGWDRKNTGKELSIILNEQFEVDCQRQFTQSGAHQADICFDVTIHKAKHSLSRGQQKIILIALKLAQASLLSKTCIYLFDDVSAELDAVHLQRLFDRLQQIKGQFIFTAIDSISLPSIINLDIGVFSLDNGEISTVSRETNT